MEPSDDALVARARSGDLSAFGRLVERHRATAFRVAARIVGDDEADDVTQEAFLRAYHRLGRFRGDASFRTWLLRITHNAALDTLARRRPTEDEERLDEHPEEERSRLPADSLERQERLRRLEGKLRLLRDEHRSVLVLRDVEGFSYGEIAEVCAMPLGSVKGRLHRARSELIDLLESNTYDWELPAR